MGPPEPGTNLFATALWDSGTQALLTISQAVEGLVPQVAAPKGRHQTCVQETWSHPAGAGRGGVHGPPVTCANLGLALGSSCEHAKTPRGGGDGGGSEMDGGGCVPPAPRAQVLGGSPGVCLRPQSLPLLLLWSHGCKPHWLSGLCVWGAIHWVGVLKVWVLGVGSKPFIPQGEAKIWGFPSDCMAPYWAGVYDKDICLSCSF